MLENQNYIKDKTIANLSKELDALKSNRAASTASNEIPWTEVIKRGKKSEARMNIVNVVSDENMERNKKEKNVIIFNLKESVRDSIAD